MGSAQVFLRIHSSISYGNEKSSKYVVEKINYNFSSPITEKISKFSYVYIVHI